MNNLINNQLSLSAEIPFLCHGGHKSFWKTRKSFWTISNKRFRWCSSVEVRFLCHIRLRTQIWIHELQYVFFELWTAIRLSNRDPIFAKRFENRFQTIADISCYFVHGREKKSICQEKYFDSSFKSKLKTSCKPHVKLK